MKILTWTDLLSYVLVSILAVGSAFLVSLRFVAHSHSQNNPAPTAAAPAKASAAQESAAAVAAEVQGFLEPFIYDSKNRRDPFQTYVDFRPAESNTNLSPLQRFDLDELHLVGIMWDIHNPKAMFIDPEKQVHVAGRDESIGKRNGYIAVIREGEVVVVESVRKDGELQFKPRVLRMER
jgi:type IV pilus assembly protein PilP